MRATEAIHRHARRAACPFVASGVSVYLTQQSAVALHLADMGRFSMRSILRLCVSLAVSVAPLLPAIALAQDSYDYNRNTNFGAIKTFGFKATPPMDPTAEKTTTYDSPLVRERTNAAIAAQLERRGMRRDDHHPDVYVVTHRTFKMDYTYYGGGPYGWGGYYGSGWGGPGWGGWYDGGYVYEELLGTLTVDLEDANTGSLLWRGVETKQVHQSSKPAKRDKRVYDEVSDVFKHFPVPGPVATSGGR
jgi:Domain of unknown function (DUF4136)